MQLYLPDIGIQGALADQLVPSEVSVVRRRDEVVTQRLVHILVHRRVYLVKHTTVFRLHVSVESLECHASVLSSCQGYAEVGLKNPQQKNNHSVGCTTLLAYVP